jgi:hypothetical protein
VNGLIILPGLTYRVIVSGSNFEHFFEQLRALPAGESDHAKIVEIFNRYEIKRLPRGIDAIRPMAAVLRCGAPVTGAGGTRG